MHYETSTYGWCFSDTRRTLKPDQKCRACRRLFEVSTYNLGRRWIGWLLRVPTCTFTKGQYTVLLRSTVIVLPYHIGHSEYCIWIYWYCHLSDLYLLWDACWQNTKLSANEGYTIHHQPLPLPLYSVLYYYSVPKFWQTMKVLAAIHGNFLLWYIQISTITWASLAQ